MRYRGLASELFLRARDTITKVLPKSDSTFNLCTPTQSAISALLSDVRNSREGRVDSKNIHTSRDKVQLILLVLIPTLNVPALPFPFFYFYISTRPSHAWSPGKREIGATDNCENVVLRKVWPQLSRGSTVAPSNGLSKICPSVPVRLGTGPREVQGVLPGARPSSPLYATNIGGAGIGSDGRRNICGLKPAGIAAADAGCFIHAVPNKVRSRITTSKG